MEPNARFRSAVRGFYLWIGSTITMVATPLISLNLAERETTVARAAAVLIGVAGMLPWMWLTFLILRRGDEFFQRLHLVALAFAFGGAILLLASLDWLVRAHFIDPPELMLVWLGCLVLWLIALVGAKFYFERTR